MKAASVGRRLARQPRWPRRRSPTTRRAAAAAPRRRPSRRGSSPLTAFPTIVRDGDNYTSWVGVADRGPLHLEARVNYESVGARSAFVGWTFSGGEEITWEVTPLLGGAWGSTAGVRARPGGEPGVRGGSTSTSRPSTCVPTTRDSKYLYAWSELGFRPVEWLRAGLVAQRTRAYGGERDIQRGPFAQLTWRRFTLGGFWFNPGASDQVVVVSIGAAF